MGVKLRIENQNDFIDLLRNLKRCGLLKDFPDRITLTTNPFPMDIPLDLGKLPEILGNPIVRKAFGKKMDTTLTAYASAMIGN